MVRIGVVKTALYVAPLAHTFVDLCGSVAREPWMQSQHDAEGCTWQGRDLALRMDLVTGPAAAVERLHQHYYNLVIVDCRHLPHHEADAEAQEACLSTFLDALTAERDRERRYPLARVAVLVGDADEDRVDRLIFAMGERHVGACLRDLSLSPRLVGKHAAAARSRLIEQFWQFCHHALVARRTGKKAISAAGGGISGIYYELGVLKCLDDVLDVGARDFDMYLGISAGAVVLGGLANGVHIDEINANIGDIGGEWPYPLGLRWRHLNVGELPKRLMLAQRDLGAYLVRMLRRQADFSVSSIVGAYAAMLGPMFDNTEVERFLREVFTQPGRVNSFRSLTRELYIGATDQDSREHVIFGTEGNDDVPISLAIQASAAAHPFFPSVLINGRYYTDGMVTRTSNLKAAIEYGADLVFIIDPFVPLISEEAGFNARHGNLWLIEQDYKTVAYTRFEQVSEEVLRASPHVNAYTFVPSNRMRALMGQNPFAARNFHPIVCEAYLSTYRRLRQLEYKLRGDLLAHGMVLDFTVAQARVQKLLEAPKADARLLINEPQELEAAPA